jgi:hypothetical protein
LSCLKATIVTCHRYTFAGMRYLLLPFLFSLPTLAIAQTRQPDQYCILEASARTKDRAALKLLAGVDPAKTGQVEEVQQVASFEYEADALNYLSSHGWEVLSVTPTSMNGNDRGVRYYLRRHRP